MEPWGYGIGVAMWVFLGFGFLALFVVIGVFFLLNLRDLLKNVGLHNRMMRPDQVWLNFIPIFNLVWMFITVSRVRDSVRYEFQSRGWAPSGDFGYGVGLAAAILNIIGYGPFGLAALVCWIIYWVRTAELKNDLARNQPPAGWVTPAAGQREG